MIAVKRYLMDKIVPITSKRLRTPEGRWSPAPNAFRGTNRSRRCVNKVVIDNLIMSVRCIRNNGGRIENLLQPKIVWFCAECPGSSVSSTDLHRIVDAARSGQRRMRDAPQTGCALRIASVYVCGAILQACIRLLTLGTLRDVLWVNATEELHC